MHTEEIFSEFEEFHNSVMWWLNKFSLGDWSVVVAEEPLHGEPHVRARCSANWEQHAANIVWNSKFVPFDSHSNVPVRDTALHEVLHLLLWDLTCVDKASQIASEHAVINRLMEALSVQA